MGCYGEKGACLHIQQFLSNSYSSITNSYKTWFTYRLLHPCRTKYGPVLTQRFLSEHKRLFSFVSNEVRPYAATLLQLLQVLTGENLFKNFSKRRWCWPSTLFSQLIVATASSPVTNQEWRRSLFSPSPSILSCTSNKNHYKVRKLCLLEKISQTLNVAC